MLRRRFSGRRLRPNRGGTSSVVVAAITSPSMLSDTTSPAWMSGVTFTPVPSPQQTPPGWLISKATSSPDISPTPPTRRHHTWAGHFDLAELVAVLSEPFDRDEVPVREHHEVVREHRQIRRHRTHRRGTPSQNSGKPTRVATPSGNRHPTSSTRTSNRTLHFVRLLTEWLAGRCRPMCCSNNRTHTPVRVLFPTVGWILRRCGVIPLGVVGCWLRCQIWSPAMGRSTWVRVRPRGRGGRNRPAPQIDSGLSTQVLMVTGTFSRTPPR